jgi:hypothetical protein
MMKLTTKTDPNFETIGHLVKLLDRIEALTDDAGIEDIALERFEIIERNPNLTLEIGVQMIDSDNYEYRQEQALGADVDHLERANWLDKDDIYYDHNSDSYVDANGMEVDPDE